MRDSVPSQADSSGVQAAGSLCREFVNLTGAHCPRCGYSLRDLQEARCPECGFGLRLQIVTPTDHLTTSAMPTLLFACVFSGLNLAAYLQMVWMMYEPLVDRTKGLGQNPPSLVAFWAESVDLLTGIVLIGWVVIAVVSGSCACASLLAPKRACSRRVMQAISIWNIIALAGICLISLLDFL